jgi:C4-type Zn-finger protein
VNKEYQKYLNSKEWLEIRIDILTTRPQCERCGSGKKLEVHHLTYKRIFKEEPSDLEVLCSGCHYKEHEKKIKAKNKPKRKPKLSLKVKLFRKEVERRRQKASNKKKLYKHLKF